MNRFRCLVAGLLAMLALGLAPAAHAQDVKIGIPTRAFTPGQVDLVPGDRVTWSNSDILTHEVRAVEAQPSPLTLRVSVLQ